MKKIFSLILPIILIIFSGMLLVSCGELNINNNDVDVKLAFNLTEFEYNGEKQVPIVALLQINGETVSSKDYEVHASNNINVGEATARVKLKGKYKGTIVRKYKILPKKLTIDKVYIRSRKYEEGNRVVEISNVSDLVLKGVVPGEDVTLNSANAKARIKGLNVDAGNHTVECYDFKIEGKDISNYVLVQPTASVNITSISQEKPVLGADKDITIEAYSNKIIVNNLNNIENLQYCITKNNGAQNWQDSNVFQNLDENTNYNVYVRRKSSTNYSSSSSLVVSVTTPKTKIEIKDITVDENIKFEKGSLEIKNTNLNIWEVSGFLTSVSNAQKDYFNNNSYNYFIPLNLTMDYSGAYETLMSSAIFTITDGVANVTKTLEFVNGENYTIELIKGISPEMIENGGFKISIIWGNGSEQFYNIDLTNIKLPTAVRTSCVELNSVVFNSCDVEITESMVENEFILNGNLPKMNISQINAFSDSNYKHFVTLYFENANVDWEQASMEIIENGSIVKSISLRNVNDTQFGFCLVKGLKTNQQSFEVRINWNSSEIVSYLFNLESCVYESVKWVDESNKLTIAGVDFYNSDSINLTKTDEFNKLEVSGENLLSSEQKNVLNTQKSNFIVLFFENMNPDYSVIEYNFGGADYSVEPSYQTNNGFYIVVLFDSNQENIELNINWNLKVKETIEFNF